MTEPRATILRTYAEWTALSALRSGAPIKSRSDIYPLLRNGRRIYRGGRFVMRDGRSASKITSSCFAAFTTL